MLLTIFPGIQINPKYCCKVLYVLDVLMISNRNRLTTETTHEQLMKKHHLLLAFPSGCFSLRQGPLVHALICTRDDLLVGNYASPYGLVLLSAFYKLVLLSAFYKPSSNDE